MCGEWRHGKLSSDSASLIKVINGVRAAQTVDIELIRLRIFSLFAPQKYVAPMKC